MADGGNRGTPKTTAPQRFVLPEHEFDESEATTPGVAFRTVLPPRIATPLGGELKPAPAVRGGEAVSKPTRQMSAQHVPPARAPSREAAPVAPARAPTVPPPASSSPLKVPQTAPPASSAIPQTVPPARSGPLPVPQTLPPSATASPIPQTMPPAASGAVRAPAATVPAPPPGLPIPGAARPATTPVVITSVPEPEPAKTIPNFLHAATIETPTPLPVTFSAPAPPPTASMPNVTRRAASLPLPGVAPVPAPAELVQVHTMPQGELRDPRLILAREPDSPAAACFRVLRHRVVAREGLRVIAVTSSGRREGKTTLALNLAMALGESGRARVLLLEANLRQPALARILGFRPPVCFGEQLELHRTHPLQPWVVVENVSPHLHTAAVSPDAVSRPIVDGPAVATALEQLRTTSYDYLVLDCPPVLGAADVNLIEEHVDGVIFALGARQSRARELRRAVDQLGRDKVIGSVLLG